MDISTPATSTQKEVYNTPGTTFNALLSQDEATAYVSDGENGLTFIDTSNHSLPTLK